MQESDLTDREKLKIETLLSILETHKGHAEAISMTKLGEMMQLSDKPLKELIHDAVVVFHSPIVGDNNGYYLAETAEEVTDHLVILKSRKTATQERYKAMLAIFKDFSKR